MSIANTTSLLSGLNPNLPGLGPGFGGGGGRDRSRSILMSPSNFGAFEMEEEESDEKIKEPDRKEKIGIRIKRENSIDENDGVVNFGNVKVDEIKDGGALEETESLWKRAARRRSTVFHEIVEELGFPEVKISKGNEQVPKPRKSLRDAKVKTQNKLAMAASERRRSLAEEPVLILVDLH